MITFDAIREHELMNRYQKLADDIDKYLNSKESVAEGMYLSRKEYKMCSEALRNYSKKKGLKDVIKEWFATR